LFLRTAATSWIGANVTGTPSLLFGFGNGDNEPGLAQFDDLYESFGQTPHLSFGQRHRWFARFCVSCHGGDTIKSEGCFPAWNENYLVLLKMINRTDPGFVN
jgi:hypothetical protein